MRARTLAALLTTVALALTGTAASPAALASPAASRALPGPSETQMVSVSTAAPGKAGGGSSGISLIGQAAISGNGRFVVFGSTSKDIGPRQMVAQSAYVRDLETGVTRNIATRPDGSIVDGSIYRPAISDDGGVIAFISEAPDIVPGALFKIDQAYIWDRSSDSFRVASVSNDAVPQLANRSVTDIDISGDGTVVAFTTEATNLDPAAAAGVTQVFAHDFRTGRTTLVSSSDTSPGAPLGAYDPSVSRDGKRIAFVSRSDLTSTPARSVQQVYLRDLTSNRTSLLSTTPGQDRAGSHPSEQPSISSDGTKVAFHGRAGELVGTALTESQVFLRDLQANRTNLISVAYDTGLPLGSAARFPAISGDGRHVTFSTQDPRAAPETAHLPGILNQIYSRDLENSSTTLVSTPSKSADGANDNTYESDVSFDGSIATFSSSATNLTPDDTSGPMRPQVFVRALDRGIRIDRIGGENRYDVSAANSADAFAPGVPVAVIASGTVYADAMSASPMTSWTRGSSAGGPVLLSSRDALPAAVIAELQRLKPDKILIAGGPASVSIEVEAQLRSYSGNVERISGETRYAVSAAIALTAGPDRDVYVASGQTFADALSASATAGSRTRPVLLTPRDSLPQAVADAITTLKPPRIIVIGGPSTVSDAVVDTLQQIAPTVRVSGADRYEVSAKVSASNFPARTPTVYVASGEVFPDALSGSAAAIKAGAPVLLVQKDGVPAAIDAELKRLKPARIVVLGGPATVSEATFEKLRAYLTS
ncbi:cell wall-binding repeat-containing protein [Herbiconiux liukaitaii]|uniref:cell wall-binding repeat-containing protein n=1 Tax=Herbiconiux liukaitaii TaxID=3342799 RepID=UPI0035B8622F